MRVKILGAHQGESRDFRFISMLVDGRLAVDAGGLTTTLSLDEQMAVEAVLLTHRHFDHIKDLPLLAHNTLQSKSLQLYCTKDTRESLQKHIFNDVIWPSMREEAEGYNPIIFNEVVPGEAFELLGYEVLALKMPHTVPTVGYSISSNGKCIFYTADTRSNGDPPWLEIRPDVLVVETTMSSEFDEQARRFKHMTPVALQHELRAFRDKQGYFPRTICVHINPKHERKVKEEIQALAQELGADVTPAHEGMVVEL
jgi:ribonuclease BN (tRNA processing enzyme)